MIKELKQSVMILPSPTEAEMIAMLGTILAAPYGNNVFDMPKTEKVIESCVKRGHLSVLEHCNISLNIITNIGTYKDYTRHRHCAFTIESTSFVRYNNELPVIVSHALTDDEINALEIAHKCYCDNPSQKEARDLLPQCCAARMIMTTNIREWRHIISLRGDPNDNPLTRELRDIIWIKLNMGYPYFFPITMPWENNPMAIYNTFGKQGELATLTRAYHLE